MNCMQILGLVKHRLGITADVRDTYLVAIIDGVLTELADVHGLALDGGNAYHLMFVVDYVTWRYQAVADTTPKQTMPRHLQFRLHNLVTRRVTPNV